MKKAELRRIYKKKRKELSKDQIRLKSLDLLQQLKETPIFENQTFHIFLPIKEQNEVFTWFFIAFLRMKEKTVVISKSNFKTMTLEHFILNRDTLLEENHYGISEPVEAQRITSKKIDVVFVPLLISDRKNNRVGYGKGFYDRFLAECREDVQTVGLNFFEPIEEIEDSDQFDIPLKTIFY